MFKKGVEALKTVLEDEKVSKKIANYLYRDKITVEDFNWTVYQVIGILLEKNDLKTIVEDIKNNRIGWESPVYDSVREKIQEHDDFIVKPFEVVEGVVECPRCHSKKTWSVQKQTRSSDEPMTTISRCAECSNTWNYSG